MNYNDAISSVRFSAKAIALIFLTLVPAQVNADGWSIFGQHDQLKNYVIVDVGAVSKVEPPFNAKWENDVFQMNGRCFTFSGYVGYWSYGEKAALLLVNAQKRVQLALIESEIGSIKVELRSISKIECPTGANVTPYNSDPDEQARLIKKRQEELKKKIEELKRQR